MSITVYYGYSNTLANKNSIIYGDAPKPVKNEYVKGKSLNELRFMKCPAFIDELKNVYEINNQYNIDLAIKDVGVESSNLPQEWFDNGEFVTHSETEKVYAINQNIILLAKEDSLEMSQQHPFLSDTNFHRYVNTIPGRLDIGKYPRDLSYAFQIKSGTNRITLKENEPLYYIKFHTNEKIKFVPFFRTEKFEELKRNVRFSGDGYHTNKPLSFYYNVFKRKNLKKLLLKEIKKNLL